MMHVKPPQMAMNAAGSPRPPIGMFKHGQFSRTTDCVIPPIQPTNQTAAVFSDLDAVPTPPGVLCCLPDVPLSQPIVPGHMITTSIDEGVEVDILERDGETLHRNPDGMRPLQPSCAYGDLSHVIYSSDASSTSISTSSYSPYTSFDSSLDSDMLSPSLNNAVTHNNSAMCNLSNLIPSQAMVSTPISSESCPPLTEGFVSSPAVTQEDVTQDRNQTRSPVNFREGRRASDGLVSHGVIAFRQRLRESMKAMGMVELRQELQNVCHTNLTKDELQNLQHCQPQSHERLAVKQWSLDDPTVPGHRPRPLVKRMSLPTEKFDFQPHKLLALKQSLLVAKQLDRAHNLEAGEPLMTAATGMASPNTNDFSPQSKSLQQHLLQHRLQQKRQTFQKHGQLQHQFQQLQLEPVVNAATIGITTVGQLACSATPVQVMSIPVTSQLDASAHSVIMSNTMHHGGAAVVNGPAAIFTGHAAILAPAPPPHAQMLQLHQQQQQATNQHLLQQQSTNQQLQLSTNQQLLQQQVMMMTKPPIVRKSSYKLAQQQTVMPMFGLEQGSLWNNNIVAMATLTPQMHNDHEIEATGNGIALENSDEQMDVT